MNQDRKNESIDYSKFFEREKEKKVGIPQKKKRFSFDNLVNSFKDFWAKTDKKTKIEMVIFLVVTLSIVIIWLFYFSQSKGVKTPIENLESGRGYVPPEEYEIK